MDGINPNAATRLNSFGLILYCLNRVAMPPSSVKCQTAVMHNHRPTDRLEYFSDAVLAIAATLLATELPKPETETGLLQAIAKQWPHYAAFAASFLFIC